jgi:hypothetical protein
MPVGFRPALSRDQATEPTPSRKTSTINSGVALRMTTFTVGCMGSDVWARIIARETHVPLDLHAAATHLRHTRPWHEMPTWSLKHCAPIPASCQPPQKRPLTAFRPDYEFRSLCCRYRNASAYAARGGTRGMPMSVAGRQQLCGGNAPLLVKRTVLQSCSS